jgi:hypothetical protein
MRAQHGALPKLFTSRGGVFLADADDARSPALASTWMENTGNWAWVPVLVERYKAWEVSVVKSVPAVVRALEVRVQGFEVANFSARVLAMARPTYAACAAAGVALDDPRLSDDEGLAQFGPQRFKRDLRIDAAVASGPDDIGL